MLTFSNFFYLVMDTLHKIAKKINILPENVSVMKYVILKIVKLTCPKNFML